MSNNIKMNRRSAAPLQGGFSLFELLAVISIIAILSTISMTGLRLLAQPSSVRAEAHRLLLAINQARQVALTYKTPTRLAFIADGDTIERYALLRRAVDPVADADRWVLHQQVVRMPGSARLAMDGPLFRGSSPQFVNNETVYQSATGSEARDFANVTGYFVIEFLPTGEASGLAQDLILAVAPAQGAGAGSINAAGSVILAVAPATGRASMLRNN